MSRPIVREVRQVLIRGASTTATIRRRRRGNHLEVDVVLVSGVDSVPVRAVQIVLTRSTQAAEFERAFAQAFAELRRDELLEPETYADVIAEATAGVRAARVALESLTDPHTVVVHGPDCGCPQ
jgi:hypothetical protein